MADEDIQGTAATPQGSWPPPPTPFPGPSRARRTLSAVVAAFLLLASGVGIGWSLSHSEPTRSTSAPSTAGSGGGSDLGVDVRAIADRVEPAVADVNTVVMGPAGRTGRAAGTGMILTPTGQVLTNNHVIEGASEIKVTIEDHGTFDATVVGADPPDDVALLQLSGASGVPTITMGDAGTVEVGDRVIAIGNALGRPDSQSVTTGTVSGLDRSITVGDGRGGSERLSDLIQTNARIVPGDSGGALLNTDGQVIGMITASSRGGFGRQLARAGFAIPSTAALSVVTEIRAGRERGSIIIGPAGFLGIGARTLDEQTAAQLDLGVSSGVLVESVNAGTPAERAGLAEGAVITAIDGERVEDGDQLGQLVHRHDPGDDVRVTWVDAAGTHTLTVTLVTGPAV